MGGDRLSSRLSWPWRGLLTASVAVPLLLLGVAAWQNYLLIKEKADAHVMNTVGELNEESLAAFDTYAGVLARVDDRIEGLDWRKIESDPDLHRFLSDLDTLPEIDTVSIADGSGRIRASGRLFPAPPVNISARAYFRVQKQPHAGLYIGRPHISRLTATPVFDISVRRFLPGGGFAGVIVAAARRDYFTKFYSAVSHEKGFLAMLLRRDGVILARYPASGKFSAFPPQGKLMRAIAAHPRRGLLEEPSEIDGTFRILGYERLAGYPLYVAFGIPKTGVFAAGRANLIGYSLFAVPAAIGLFVMTLFAARQLRRQQIASWRWRSTALRLRREVERRAQAEAELRQAQKIDALGQLTGGVAHDFNNLLTVLQGNLEMLRSAASDQKSRDRIDQALRTVARGAALTARLLAFARRQPLKIESFDLDARLGAMAELLERTVGRGISLETNFAPDLWPAKADPAQLELAVINLAINARDAMEKGGILRIRTFNQPESAINRKGDLVALEISDTGSGMTPAVLARAFEPFFTTKEPGRGTGLGLSMVDDFTRRAGGVVRIASELGRGTTVTIFLPRGERAASAHEEAKAALPPGGSG